jgi:tight adherence protein C
MQIAVLSTLVFVYALVLALFWRKAKSADHMAGRFEGISKIGSSVTDASELNRPFAERFLKPAAQGFMRWLSGLMPKTENPRLANNLRLAGYAGTSGEYNATKLLAIVGGGVAGAVYGILQRNSAHIIFVGFLAGAAATVIVMRFSLKSKIKKRKLAIQKQLPEVLDLLSVSVEAGLGFDAALQRIAARTKGPLVDELNTAYREITLGRPRAEALRNFEQRCGLEEVKSFVSAIIQAEQLGISLKNVLKSQAQQMRLLKRQKVEEKAMKAPVKIIIPLVFFVFPVLFIILLAPAVINIVGMKGLFG